MSKEDIAPGLFSKLVKLVRSPATSWTELDSVQTDRDDLVSKQLLKEMIERKRRNDFVRRREFDMLRKLRKLEVLTEVTQDQGANPSFFHSSLPSRPDDRAETLKKIDEIEAQMSRHWWKTKSYIEPGDAVIPSLPHGGLAATQALASDEVVLPLAYQSTVAAEWGPEHPKAAVASEPLLDNIYVALNQPDAAKGNLLGSNGMQDGSVLPTIASSSDFAFQATAEPVMLEHDAELEEAAILFANGDNAGAQAGLLDILSPGSIRAEHVETWLTLFDLYRATGEQDKFEVKAIEFSERFQRSPPQWFSLPDIMKLLVKPGDKTIRGPAADWICPSVLGLQTVATLNAAMARIAMPWRLDWNNLKTIEAAALAPLCKVFSLWANEPVQLRFMGDAQLQNVLLNATPSNQQSIDQRWWMLRMEMLRVIHRPDDFELAALDFCVTYELSPPSWESARCQYKSLDAYGDILGNQTIIGEPSHEPAYSALNPLDVDSWPGVQSLQANRFLAVELSGQIQGDAALALARLEDRLTGADMMQISCAKLIRVDFSAAGMLLNWVSARHAENRLIQFCEVNRLVAAFFNIIGITEYAKVVVRID